MGLSIEEKKKILKALEEDPEFRYMIMGLLGYREILDRITKIDEKQQKLMERFAKLEEQQQKLEERFVQIQERQQKLEEMVLKLVERQQKLEEMFAKLEERFAQLEERFAKLEERQQLLEERFVKLEERQQRLEERFAQLEERFAKLEERFARIEERQQKLDEELLALKRSHEELVKRMIDLEKLVVTIAHRFGVITEGAFREALSGILSKYFGAEASKMSIYDEEGIVYGHPSVIDIDVVVKDNVHIVIEVKSRANRSDVYELYRIGKLYARKKGVKPKLALVTAFIDDKARELAARYGIEVYTYIEEKKYLWI